MRAEMSQPSSVTGDLLNIRNILIATDFSESSARALDHALEIAARYEARLHVFHCIEPTLYNLAGPDAVQMACDAAWRDMQQLVSDLRKKGQVKNVELKLLVEAGDLATILPAIVQRLDLGLIVVGTHGRTGWRKLVLGSVAEIVIRQASCPVLTVGPCDRGLRLQKFGLKSIVFVNDASAQSALAESYAFSLAHKWNSRLTILRVLEEQSGRVLAEASQIERCGAEWTDVLQKGLTSAPQLPTGVGSRGDLILQVADEAAADLIVLAVRDAYSFTDRFRSTYGYQVVRSSPCPVLTVRDQ